MLPTHGAVTSVFHLANSMRHTTYPCVSAWVDAASARSSFLAAAIDHRPTADFLLGANLALRGAKIEPSPALNALSRQADRRTLIAIARLLLEVSPPEWLQAAVRTDVRYEFIPSADLQSLGWMCPELEQVLIDAASGLPKRSDSIAHGLGRAAELAIFSALDKLHTSPVHVSEISDRFGYDIETARGPALRWEVKGCTTRTARSFHLSRNEFDKSQQYPHEWRLVQVEFAPGALTAEFLTGSHVRAIRELNASQIAAMVPSETGVFSWETSALITPPTNSWELSTLTTPKGFRLPGVAELGKYALEARGSAS